MVIRRIAFGFGSTPITILMHHNKYRFFISGVYYIKKHQKLRQKLDHLPL